jgi:hypothetical protein
VQSKILVLPITSHLLSEKIAVLGNTIAAKLILNHDSVTDICIIKRTIHVTGRGDPQGCETSRLPRYLENRLTDGSEVVNLTRRHYLNFIFAEQICYLSVFLIHEKYLHDKQT